MPLDGSTLSECAVPFAAAVAQALSARVTLLRVLDPHRTTAAGGHVDAVEWEMRRAEAECYLARFEHALGAAGLASGVRLLEGRSAERIIHFAREHEVDLIVLSSHGEGGLSGWVLSSTAQKVVARAHTSVLVVPAYAAEEHRIGHLRFERILVPLDCSPRAECALPLAAAFARAHDAELILAHVVPEPEMPRRMPPSVEDVALAAQLTERNRVAGERYLNELRNRLAAQGMRASARVVVSRRRARAIRELADQEAVDLVLLAAHGTTGDPSEHYGTVAARLLQESSRPMIVFQDVGETVAAATLAEETARSHPGH